MTFSALRKAVAEQQADRHEYFLDLYRLDRHTVPADAFEHIDDEDLYPSNRYFPITLYYDPDRITERKRQKLFRDISLQPLHRGRILRMRALQPDRLGRVSISLGPRFERLFLARGYVTDVEGRTTVDRGRLDTFKVVERNFATLRANAHLWARMLSDQGEAMFGKHLVKEHKRLAVPILGKRRRNERPIPLIRHADLFLGSEGPTYHDFLLAHSTTPREAFAESGRSEAQEFLFGNLGREPIEQLEFELANAQVIWGGRRRVRAENRAAASAAVVVWFSQAVAAQRRISWDSEIRRKWPVEQAALRSEAKLHPNVIGVHKIPAKGRARALQQQIEWEINQIIGRTEKDTWNEFIGKISRDERILAALHGSIVDLPAADIHELIESKEYLVIIAHWIGTLKRTGTQVFDENIARWLRLGWKSIKSSKILYGQFPKTTWLRLIASAGKYCLTPAVRAGALPRCRIEGFSKPFTVTYEWVTMNTLDHPTACSWEGEVLALRGPMLCFPADKLLYWKQKASIIVRLKGFWARAK
ncbi:hypothetical protein [Bradyrhizobium japonicum]|uniref:hypothetical protein n=1 Tax=Bradyrhizobium japonicum TaxID=375 RepID=UPI00200ED20D|nr:hypothetical protein [Bradyrhizobium japonicum]UQD95992.1 hypothetical protein JEY30_31080 [Bradyrhizobium japonicum]